MRSKERFTLIFALFLFSASLAWGQSSVAGPRGDPSWEEEPGVGLEVGSNVRGADVYLNGWRIGRTPLYAFDIKPGSYSLRVEKEGYEPYLTMIYIDPGYKQVIYAYLEALAGSLLILPGDTGAKIAVDGKRVSAGLVKIAVGPHVVTAELFGYKKFEAKVFVPEYGTVIVEIALESIPAELESLKVHKKTINPSGRESFAATFFTLSASGPLEVSMEILDASGTSMFRKDLGLLRDFDSIFSFDGRDASGAALPDGTYSLVISDSEGKFRLSETFSVDSKLTVIPMGIEGGLLGLAEAPSPFLLPEFGFILDAGFGYRTGNPTGIPLDARIGLTFSPSPGNEQGLLYEGGADTSSLYLWSLWYGGKLQIFDWNLIRSAFHYSFLIFTNDTGMDLVSILPEGKAGISLGFGSDAIGLSASIEAEFGLFGSSRALIIRTGAGAWISLEGFKLGLSASAAADMSTLDVAWPVKGSIELSFPSGFLSGRLRADFAVGSNYLPYVAGFSAGASLVF